MMLINDVKDGDDGLLLYSMEIWMCVLFAYIGVSIVLFLVSRYILDELFHIDYKKQLNINFLVQVFSVRVAD